jgi:hypothetical protein
LLKRRLSNVKQRAGGCYRLQTIGTEKEPKRTGKESGKGIKREKGRKKGRRRTTDKGTKRERKGPPKREKNGRGLVWIYRGGYRRLDIVIRGKQGGGCNRAIKGL